MDHNDIDEWFGDENNKGICSIQEAVDLTELPETYVRAYCRREGLRRVGATYVMDEVDVRDLIAEADEDAALDEEVAAAGGGDDDDPDPEDDDEDSDEEE